MIGGAANKAAESTAWATRMCFQVGMTCHPKHRAERKRGNAALDAQLRADSLSRVGLTDLALDLALVDGEAALVFAHMRDVLADLASVKVDGGGAAP